MPKAPPRLSLMRRLVAAARRNPIKTVTAVLSTLAVIPGAAVGANYLATTADPWVPAFRTDVQVVVGGKKVPLIVLALEHSTTLDYLILKDQRQALKDAKTDMEKAPNSTTQQVIDQLQKSIQQRQDRLDKATSGR